VNIKYLKNWVFFLAVLLFSATVFAKGPALSATIAVAQLPREAQQTLMLIKQGGPFPYPKDGAVFGNYEKILPIQKRGYYREYTVRTPGARNRGARRIVTGGAPATSGEYYYTADHYTTFHRIQE
jgi:ribonuclease T1